MKHTILLVDDEASVLDGIRRSLRNEPYEILTATRGAQVLELLQTVRASVIVSDEMMPGMSGTELLAKVRAQYPDIVRIMLTGQATMEAAVRCINEGEIYRFLMKPINHLELAIAIRQGVEQQEMLKDLRNLSKIVVQQTALIESFSRQALGFVEQLRNLNPVGESEQTTDVDTETVNLRKYLTGDQSRSA